jgi:DNA-binding CsgD family transcriptional regulator
MRNPGLIAWRASLAPALAAAGGREEALSLAREEVALARAFEVPRELGMALRASGLVEGGETGIELLQEAVGVLETTPAELEHARALSDLGAALRRAGRRSDARDPLRAGLDLAGRCGANALVDRAHSELVAAGARPRRMVVSGAEALTASERRVAELASEGLTNREIAQTLFVTEKTVESHLGHAYRKLDISARSQLADALAGRVEPVTP